MSRADRQKAQRAIDRAFKKQKKSAALPNNPLTKGVPTRVRVHPARSRKRIAGWGTAIVLSIGIPIAIDQEYFRHNSYALPALAMIALVLYLVLLLTTKPMVKSGTALLGACDVVDSQLKASFKPTRIGIIISSSFLMAGFLFVVWSVALSASKRHIAELLPAGPQQRPYDLTDGRRASFLNLLVPPKEHDIIRVGCLGWSDSACVAAGSFLLLFSEAGWPIDPQGVYRMTTGVPTSGMTMVTLADKQSIPKPLPPHLGTWKTMSKSEIVMFTAFTKMGMRVNGSSQTDLPVGTLGIYFGPEPDRLYPVMLPPDFDQFEKKALSAHESTTNAR